VPRVRSPEAKLITIGVRLVSRVEVSRLVFLNRRAATQYRALASILLGPHLIEKTIYLATFSQRLRTTGVDLYLACLIHLYLRLQDTKQLNAKYLLFM
jgi:hypothetical protein